MTAEEEHDTLSEEFFFGENFSVGFDVGQHADEIVAFSETALRDEFPELLGKGEEGVLHNAHLFHGVLRLAEEFRDNVRPCHELALPSFRNAEQFRDDVDRQGMGYLAHELGLEARCIGSSMRSTMASTCGRKSAGLGDCAFSGYRIGVRTRSVASSATDER